MAGLKKRIKASTLIEVMVGMVIIITIFTSGFVLIINIGRYYQPRQKLYASLKMNEVYQQTIENKSYNDEVLVLEGITIEKSVKNYDNMPQLKLITLEGYNKKHQLILKKQYIKVVQNRDEFISKKK